MAGLESKCWVVVGDDGHREHCPWALREWHNPAVHTAQGDRRVAQQLGASHRLVHRVLNRRLEIGLKL
jgi:hypothetical protein